MSSGLSGTTAVYYRGERKGGTQADVKALEGPMEATTINEGGKKVRIRGMNPNNSENPI